MKAVILCAGEGERLRPITENCPKTLIPVNGKPILYYVFKSLPEEIDEVFVVIQEKQQKHFDEFFSENNFIQKVTFLYQSKDKWGTYYALMTAKKHLQDEEKFLYLNGDDIFYKDDLEKLIECDAPTYALDYKMLDGRYRTCDLDFDTMKITAFRKQKPEEEGRELPCFSGAITLSGDFFEYEPVIFDGKEAGVPHTLFGARVPVGFFILSKWFQINTHEDLELVKKVFTS